MFGRTRTERIVDGGRIRAVVRETPQDACEPENRLVARTLERAWERSLEELRAAERALAARRARRPEPLSAEEIAWRRRAGADLRRVMESAATSDRERKQLLHAVIAEVVVTVDREPGVARLRIVWEDGAVTERESALNRTGAHFRTTAEEIVQLVRRLAEHYRDAQIAAVLTRHGPRTGAGNSFTASRVRSLRLAHGIPAGPVTPACQDGEVVSVHQAASALGVSTATVHRWLREGVHRCDQPSSGGPLGQEGHGGGDRRGLQLPAQVEKAASSLVPEMTTWICLGSCSQKTDSSSSRAAVGSHATADRL